MAEKTVWPCSVLAQHVAQIGLSVPQLEGYDVVLCSQQRPLPLELNLGSAVSSSYPRVTQCPFL